MQAEVFPDYNTSKNIFATVMYIISPRMSLVVVINGPVATAGSILSLFSTNGMTVPNKEAKIITINKVMLTE
jgi:hypothetical protein